MRSGSATDVQGTLPQVIQTGEAKLLTTTIFVKYNYTEVASKEYQLVDAVVAALPNGMLQSIYNPTAVDTIWRVGRNAPTRGEAFRARLVFNLLKQKVNWRVQTVPMPPERYAWDD